MTKKSFRPREASRTRYPTWEELSSRRSFLSVLGGVVASGALASLPACDDGPYATAGLPDSRVWLDRGPDQSPDVGAPDASSPDAGAADMGKEAAPGGPEGGLIPLDDHGPSGQPPALDATKE